MGSKLPWGATVRIISASVLGYIVIGALTTFGFDDWLEGADLYRGNGLLKLKGAVVAIVSGLVGGVAAALIGCRRPVLHAAAVLPFLVMDTGYVLFFFPRTSPAWFELGGGLTLMAATLAGGWIVAKLGRPSPT